MPPRCWLVIAPEGIINQSLGHRSHSQLSPITSRGRRSAGADTEDGGGPRARGCRAHPEGYADEQRNAAVPMGFGLRLHPQWVRGSCQGRQTAQTGDGAVGEGVIGLEGLAQL